MEAKSDDNSDGEEEVAHADTEEMKFDIPRMVNGFQFAYDCGDEPEEEDDEMRNSDDEDDDE